MPAADGGPFLADHFGGDHRTEVADVGRALLDQLDAALAEQDLGVDDVHPVGHGVFQQPGGEGRRQQPRVLLGHFALVAQPAGDRRAVIDLGQQQAQPIGDVQVAAQASSVFGSSGDMLTDCLMAPVVKKSISSSAASTATLVCGLFGAGPQVRRAKHVGHAEQRAVRARLGRIDVQGHAAEMAAAEPFDQGLLRRRCRRGRS